MFLRYLKLWNFRKYGSADSVNRAADLELEFQPGLNLLVGENDSGKTAILDAIKLVTLTKSNEYLRISPEDFYHPTGGAQTNNHLRIECVFDGFEDDEAKNFLEWLSIKQEPTGQHLTLRLFIEASLKGVAVLPYDIRAGSDDEGTALSAEARNLIRCTYLKALRDAETELSPRKNSRLSQILDNHEAFQDKVNHPLVQIASNANLKIRNYFKGVNEQGNIAGPQEGKAITDTIDSLLESFFGKSLSADFMISAQSLRNILEKLELILERGNNGLGSHNLLFIAAELLLSSRTAFTGLRLALVEEIEAHLHPQAQLRLIEFLAAEASTHSIQLLITSHSPILASKVPLANLIICKNSAAFPMAPAFTELEIGDYAFLERFLDSTKANLFFAESVLLVEGDAENILLPEIARLIGRDLTKYGVSVVNIGNVALNRYSAIFKRKDATHQLPVRVACLTDNDISLNPYPVQPAINQHRADIAARYDGQFVRTFVSPIKTLEYDLARSVTLRQSLYMAALLANKLKNSDRYGVTFRKLYTARRECRDRFREWTTNNVTDHEIAMRIWEYISINKLKSITPQFFTALLRKRAAKEDINTTLRNDAQCKYIIDAITYVTAQ